MANLAVALETTSNQRGLLNSLDIICLGFICLVFRRELQGSLFEDITLID